MITRQDEFLVGLGPDVAVSRTYNSLGDRTDENEDNWRQSTDRRIYGLSTADPNVSGSTLASTVKRVSGDGSVITYSWDVNKDAYVATDGAGAHDRLSFADGVWTWTDGATQVTEKYAQAVNATLGSTSWRIIEQADSESPPNKLTFTYLTGTDRLDQVTTQDGSYVKYSWDGSGRIIKLITGFTNLKTGLAETLTRTLYAYESTTDRLKTVTVDRTPENVADSITYTTSYTYDSAGRVDSVTQKDGSTVAFTYDASGRIATVVQTLSATVSRTTQFGYYAGYTSVTDPSGQSTRLTYDSKGQLTRITAPAPYTDGTRQTIDFQYNGSGDVTHVTDQSGMDTVYEFDDRGNATKITDRLGNITVRTYTASNQIATETRKPPAGETGSQLTTRYIYDAENHLRFVLHPEGRAGTTDKARVTEYRYTDSGNLQNVIRYPEHVYELGTLASNEVPTLTELTQWRDGLADRSSTMILSNVYDPRGNLTQSTNYGYANTGGVASTAEGYSRTYFSYDQAGNLLSRNRAGENPETFVYDGLGRVLAATDVNGGTTSISFYDAVTTSDTTKTVVTLANGLVRTSTYNRAGELIAETESGDFLPSPVATQNVYDHNGRLIKAKDATGRAQYFVYDNAGRKVAVVNDLGEVTEYRYDANNRIHATTRYINPTATPLATIADPDADVTAASIRPAANAADLWTWNVYDAGDQLIGTIDGDGSATSFAYDPFGRLIKTTAHATAVSAATLAELKGRRATAADLPLGTTSDRVSRNFFDKDGNLIGVLNGEGYLTQIFRDDAGRKVKELTFLNRTEWTIRATGSLTALADSITTTPDDRRTHYVYDGQGLLRYTVDGLNQPVLHNYDTAGRPTVTVAYAGSIAATSDYSYDNIEALVVASGLGSHSATRKSWTVYDGAGRVAYAIDSGNSVTGFSYDNLGQVTKSVRYAVKRSTTSLPSLATMDTWAAGQATNTANRITHNYYSDRPGEVVFSVQIANADYEGYVTRFTYDGEGRKTAETRWSNPIQMNDDPTAALVQSRAGASGASVVTSFEYDPTGRLIASVDGLLIRRTYDYYANGLLKSETVADGTADAVTTHFTYDAAGQLTARRDAFGTADEALSQFEYGALGDLVRETDARGNKTYHYYDRVGQRVESRDAADHVTLTSYNAFREVTSVTRRYEKATNVASTAERSVVATNSSKDSTTKYAYDLIGRLVTETDPNNIVTTRTYTAHGDLETISRAGATTTFEYDRMGRLLKTTDAMNLVESYVYNVFGDRTSVTNKAAGVTSYGYDRRGLMTSETLPMSSVRADGTSAATSVVNRFEYDARGNRTKRIEADGLAEARTTEYVYDSGDRLIETRHEAVSVLSQTDHIATSTVTPKETFKYDPRGNVIETTDAAGARTLSYYDKLDRKIVEIGPLGTYSDFTYDANGNLTRQRVFAATVTLPGTAGGAAPAAPTGAYRETRYSYDALNRLETVSIPSVDVGAWNGTAYIFTAASTAAITLATHSYDARGNVIKTVDASGGTVFSYYDKGNRKTAEVDADKHLTSWTYDGNGNVMTETRRATKVTTTVTTTSAPTVATSAKDRITEFTYDANGRRLTETRKSVEYGTRNADGTVTRVTGDAQIIYDYNNLGQVEKKTEASGDTVDYVYDKTGRLTRETRAAYIDHAGLSVTPTVEYFYDGLNNLTRTRQGGAAAAAGDRYTRYTYGDDGRLTEMKDAAGQSRLYFYDAAGNVVRESYEREKSDGSVVTESILYTRDLIGRVTAQRLAAWVPPAGTAAGYWVKDDKQNFEYNAFGEVSRRGLNDLWQERFDYDNAGRLWRSTGGDGIWRYFASDNMGNRTLTIESEGTDIANKTTLADAITAARGSGTTVGAVFVDGINSTITVYDKRGLATQTIQPHRQMVSLTATTTLTSTRTYNAFGEVARETDARGQYTDFTYNNMGRLIEKKSPAVSWMSESGTIATGTPIETYYHDLSGREIGVKNANDKTISRDLLAGTGYGGAAALVAAEYHPDGGIARTFYDVFGDARKLRNEINLDELRSYDSLGRLTSVVHRGGLLTDTYAYDVHGQRIRHSNSFLKDAAGVALVETTDYDMQGRITRTATFGGDVTTTAYSWSGTLTNAGVTGTAAVGGWTETTTYANGRTLVETSDMFGRLLSKTDLGSHVFTYAYDKAGRMSSQAVGGETLTYGWYNTGLSYSILRDSSNHAHYTYDELGRKMSEVTVKAGLVVQDASATYDALGRMKSYNEVGGSITPAANISWTYDLAGNIRRTTATHALLDREGNVSGTATKVHSFLYDAMNRVTYDGGAPTGPVSYEYDAAGNRRKANRSTEVTYDANGGEPESDPFWVTTTLHNNERYEYRADGTLSEVWIKEDSLDASTVYRGTEQRRSLHTHDEMGRLTKQQDFWNSTDVAWERSVTYNAKGQATNETVNRKDPISAGVYDTYVDVTVNTYGSGSAYALGAIVSSTSDTSKNGSDGDVSDTSTTNSFTWWDGAVQSQISYDSNTGDSGNALWTTSFSYGASGVLQSVSIVGGRSRTITYKTDMMGQGLRRDENGSTNTTAGDPHEVWYRFDGKQLGYTGNNGTLETDYSASIGHRAANPVQDGQFLHGSKYATEHADFGQSLDPINSWSQGSAGGSYTVREGDTLQGIAAQLWGDASLWYKIAEANGMTAAAGLVQGQSLTIPVNVLRSGHNAGTFQPYDASEAMGQVSPTSPKPNKSNKCGVFGAVLLTVVSVAVSFALPVVAPGIFAAGGFLGSVGGAVAASMIGSAVSQGVGLATGIQDKFSWKGVAVAGLSAAVGGGLGKVLGPASVAGSKVLTDMV
ncbi:MAG: LysM peptidoglycan-binding domain-containing protein, partial [Pseudomonadota bacterium]|nr:LysM peptidoglycan-binding domain-containing protein [Pseudomonadota bacterium]